MMPGLDYSTRCQNHSKEEDVQKTYILDTNDLQHNPGVILSWLFTIRMSYD
jgi:hypothetical protein